LRETFLFHAGERADQSGLCHINLGGLNEALIDIAEPGLEQNNLPKRFEHAEPFCCRRRADADVSGEIRIIELLGRTQSTSAKKTLKIS
jgi:hypothetical protein